MNTFQQRTIKDTYRQIKDVEEALCEQVGDPNGKFSGWVYDLKGDEPVLQLTLPFRYRLTDEEGRYYKSKILKSVPIRYCPFTGVKLEK